MKTILLFFFILFPASVFAAYDVRVIDGDTVSVPMTAVVGLPSRVSVRFIGVNTPEMHGKCAKEKQLAQAAKLYVQDRFAQAKTVTIQFVRWDKYARADAKITIDGADLATDLLKAGLAVPYNGGKRDPMFWCKP